MASRYESDMTRKEKMQLEKEKLSKMNFKEKLAYIWEYYKAVIFRHHRCYLHHRHDCEYP